jgi:hypothetical protein
MFRVSKLRRVADGVARRFEVALFTTLALLSENRAAARVMLFDATRGEGTKAHAAWEELARELAPRVPPHVWREVVGEALCVIVERMSDQERTNAALLMPGSQGTLFLGAASLLRKKRWLPDVEDMCLPNVEARRSKRGAPQSGAAPRAPHAPQSGAAPRAPHGC